MRSGQIILVAAMLVGILARSARQASPTKVLAQGDPYPCSPLISVPPLPEDNLISNPWFDDESAVGWEEDDDWSFS